MLCADFRTQLHDYLDGRLVATKGSCESHLAGCADCARLAASARRLRESLTRLPVPPPGAGFETRILQAALPSLPPPRPRRWPRYIAALILLLAVAAAITLRQQPFPAPGSSANTAIATQDVRVVVTAPRDLPGARLRLELPEGTEFTGYRGQRVLEWTADLSKGPNLLELKVRGDGQGLALATIQYGGSRRTLAVPLDRPGEQP